MELRISSTKTPEEALANEVPNMINFTDGEGGRKDQRIIVNGRDYSGVKDVSESETDGCINVDGRDVKVRGFEKATDIEVYALVNIFALGDGGETQV